MIKVDTSPPRNGDPYNVGKPPKDGIYWVRPIGEKTWWTMQFQDDQFSVPGDENSSLSWAFVEWSGPILPPDPGARARDLSPDDSPASLRKEILLLGAENERAKIRLSNLETRMGLLDRKKSPRKKAIDSLSAACKTLVREWDECFAGQRTGYEGTPLEDAVEEARAALAIAKDAL